jgi:cobalt/nickel transport system permease protein
VHISEGILPPEVWIAGAAVAAGGVAIGLRKTDYEQLPRVAVVSSAFFVASLIHVPVLGATSVHLVLNGLAGVVLGWAAFPALLVALVLQAVLFGFGGPTTLGVNTLVMAAPAVTCYYLFRRPLRARRKELAAAAAFAAGALAVALSVVLLGAVLLAAGEHFLPVVQLALVAHVPVMVVEGLVTASAVLFVRKVRPELLAGAARGKELADAASA